VYSRGQNLQPAHYGNVNHIAIVAILLGEITKSMTLNPSDNKRSPAEFNELSSTLVKTRSKVILWVQEPMSAWHKTLLG
jgi:hypothetical protein